MGEVIVLKALGDNYIYLYVYSDGKAAAVDPGEAGVVIDTVEQKALKLTHILVTHSHFDHTGGVNKLESRYGSKVIAGGQGEVQLGNGTVRVIETPGHTRDSVCYYIDSADHEAGVLFTGDTLFIGGCGRCMGCDEATMWESLKRIAALPEDTLVYPGHNYTQENYEFALTVDRDDPEITELLRQVRESPVGGDAVLPSTVGREKNTNIFLRSGQEKVKALAGMAGAGDSEVFAELRRKKNFFG
jgi:hydroxyacylglutathione hydrolase